MIMSMRPFIVVLGAGLLATSLTTSARQGASPLPPLVLPAGFQAEVFAEKVENARSMAIGPQGTVFVGSQYVGKVHAVVDADKDHKADRVVVIASGLDQPNGLAVRNGALYVATASRLLRFDDIDKHLDAPPAPVTVRADLPNPKAGHTWKFIGFGPDDMLYMSALRVTSVSPPNGVGHRADEAGWIRHGIFRRGRAQQCRVRLAPGDA
jgi:glucose/arabinose dehydrogenase